MHPAGSVPTRQGLSVLCQEPKLRGFPPRLPRAAQLPPLPAFLRRLGVRQLSVVGVQTPNCIRATAFDAVALGYHPVMVLRDATASESEAVQDANLYDLRRVGVATPAVEEWAIGLIAAVAAKEAI